MPTHLFSRFSAQARGVLALALTLFCSIALVHCVGDVADVTAQDGGADGNLPDTTQPVADGSSGGVDATTADTSPPDDAAKNDGAAGDAGSDAPPGPRCSPDGGWGTPQVVPELNDTHNSGGATLSADELTVYFTSDRLRDGGTGGFAGYDVFTGTRADPSAAFANIRRVPVSDPSGDVPDLYASQTSNNLKLYFDTYRPGRGVWVSTRASTVSDYTTAAAVTIINNGGGENGTPYVLPDESAIYFTSSRGGAGFDVYRAPITGGVVGASALVGGGVSSAAAELNVAVSPDDLTIYFGSARDNTGYDMDIWVATRPNTAAQFGNLTKLPANVNDRTGGATANYPSFVTADGCVLYYSRQISGVTQIWRVKRN